MNDLNGPTGGGPDDHRFPTLAEPEQREHEPIWRDWLLIGGMALTLAFGAGVAVYTAAVILGAVWVLVF